MNIREASVADIGTIRDIALRTWPVAYGEILSPAQLAYMLALMYSTEALQEQLSVKGHRFALCIEAGEAIGFASYAHDQAGNGPTRLHKLYALPARQLHGAGRALLQHVIEAARKRGSLAVELNVNRSNKARGFYEKHGFRVVRDEVIDIGHGYVMDDHVMELSIR